MPEHCRGVTKRNRQLVQAGTKSPSITRADARACSFPKLLNVSREMSGQAGISGKKDGTQTQ